MMSKSVYGLSPAQLAVAAALLVGLSSLLTRRTEIEFTEEIFIEVGEEHVYDFLSDVRLLDLVHPFRVGAFNLTPSTGSDGYEEVKYTNIEKVDYFGLYEDALVFPVHTRFMKPLGEIRSSYDVLDGTLLAQQCFSLRAAERNGANGTLVTDTSRIWLPWMYAHFTMWKGGEAHHRILGGMKALLERGYRIDNLPMGRLPNHYHQPLLLEESLEIKPVFYIGNFDESQACADNTTVQECPSEKTVCYSTKWTIPTSKFRVRYPHHQMDHSYKNLAPTALEVPSSINNGKGEMTGFTRGCAKVGIEPGCYKNADKIIVCTSYCLTDGCNTDDPGSASSLRSSVKHGFAGDKLGTSPGTASRCCLHCRGKFKDAIPTTTTHSPDTTTFLSYNDVMWLYLHRQTQLEKNKENNMRNKHVKLNLKLPGLEAIYFLPPGRIKEPSSRCRHFEFSLPVDWELLKSNKKKRHVNNQVFKAQETVERRGRGATETGVHSAHAYVIAVAMATQIMTGTLGLECLQCFATSLPSSSEAVDRCRNFTNPAEAEPCTDGNARYCFVQEKIVADRTTQFNRGCSRTQVGAGCREMPEPIVEGTDCIVYCNDFPGCNNATSRAVALHDCIGFETV
ncbi:hypothetical protein Bbelb_367300 [Branchiostoma belcheri]|nr:hypothetical protein Bbelb_367300 [Branchiostoma belcheri]